MSSVHSPLPHLLVDIVGVDRAKQCNPSHFRCAVAVFSLLHLRSLFLFDSRAVGNALLHPSVAVLLMLCFQFEAVGWLFDFRLFNVQSMCLAFIVINYSNRSCFELAAAFVPLCQYTSPSASPSPIRSTTDRTFDTAARLSRVYHWWNGLGSVFVSVILPICLLAPFSSLCLSIVAANPITLTMYFLKYVYWILDQSIVFSTSDNEELSSGRWTTVEISQREVGWLWDMSLWRSCWCFPSKTSWSRFRTSPN
jgi:hypothetical protein